MKAYSSFLLLVFLWLSASFDCRVPCKWVSIP